MQQVKRAAPIILALLAMLGAPPVRGEGLWSLVVENDLFADLDRHYTNGVQLSYAAPEGAEPDWLRELAQATGLFPEQGRFRATFALGQSMFTPKDISLADPPRDDRPYAGWLYGGAGLTAIADGVEHSFEVLVGVVGPSALAEETQKLVHRLLDAQEPRGWDTQLHDEPTLTVSYERRRRLVSGEIGRFDWQVTPHAGLSLGNALTFADLGATAKLGWRMPADFGPPRIRPSVLGSTHFEAQRAGFYVFASLEGRAVARNMFLEGNSFRDSRGVTAKPLVADLQFGAVLALPRGRLGYTHVIRSAEFEGQGAPDSFGALSLTLRF